jgi:hypothetical protein
MFAVITASREWHMHEKVKHKKILQALRLGLYWNRWVFGKKDLGTKICCISIFPF